MQYINATETLLFCVPVCSCGVCLHVVWLCGVVMLRGYVVWLCCVVYVVWCMLCGVCCVVYVVWCMLCMLCNDHVQK